MHLPRHELISSFCSQHTDKVMSNIGINSFRSVAIPEMIPVLNSVRYAPVDSSPWLTSGSAESTVVFSCGAAHVVSVQNEPLEAILSAFGLHRTQFRIPT